MELSIIIGVTFLLAGIMRMLQQPLIIGHILTGILVGPQGLDLIGSSETLLIFSQIGIALLLYIVGLSVR